MAPCQPFLIFRHAAEAGKGRAQTPEKSDVPYTSVFEGRKIYRKIVASPGRSPYLYVNLKVMKIQSTLASIASLVWESETVDQAKETLTEHLRSTDVKDRDKMINDVEKLKTLEAVHRYVANSLLKYEGLSVKV